ncbi:MAG: DUF2652 domain-containing protein [Acidimicrobiia bacterium]
MTLDLGTPEHGCLMLADISGYTEYMGSTELMHAQDVIADLLETIVGAVEPVFTLSKLEGDAAFAYVNTETVNTSMLMDTVESAYFAFQKRLRDIVHATSCPCDACIRIPDLDLKFFIHDGEYVVRHIARSEELTGPDVILVHRLAKGTATDIVGKHAYAVYTKATLDAMEMSPSILGFVPHTEDLDGIGEVEVFVQDLSIRWTFEQERNRDFVNASDAVYEVSFETPAAPEVVWDHLTDPVKRPEWQKLVSEVVTQTEGRRGVGTINHCMHGSDVILEHVSDWRPFSYLTRRYALGDIEDWAWTLLLEPDDGTTKVTMRISDPGGGAWEMIGPDFSASIDDQAGDLKALLLTATG